VTAQETHDAWVSAFIAITAPPANERQAPCPNCGYYCVRLQFVAAPASRIGFCALRCENCGHGHVLSRTKVPAAIDFLPLDCADEVLRSAIPDFYDATSASRDSVANASLSPREAQVLDLIRAGMRPQRIADELKLSRSTVNTVKQRISLKLGLRPTEL